MAGYHQVLYIHKQKNSKKKKNEGTSRPGDYNSEPKFSMGKEKSSEEDKNGDDKGKKIIKRKLYFLVLDNIMLKTNNFSLKV